MHDARVAIRIAGGVNRKTGQAFSAARAAARCVLHSVLGGEFCEYWVNTRRWEWLMFHTTGGDPMATNVTQWELDRLFEIV